MTYKRTLYISDLDGTLLRPDERTSDLTNETINKLVDNGLIFSYATARSYYTSHKVTAGLTASFPVILYNGAFIKDNKTGKMLLKNFFEPQAVMELMKDLTANGISPVVYAFVDGDEKFSYDTTKINKATREFADSRTDARKRPVTSYDELTAGEIFYITCIDDPQKLEPLFRKYQDIYHCVYQRDIYSNEQWLEIMPKAASKANAALQLKELLKCDRIVAFGDGINDADMFDIADCSYAVENAVPELKKRATGVIGSNSEDGVAKFLPELAGLKDIEERLMSLRDKKYGDFQSGLIPTADKENFIGVRTPELRKLAKELVSADDIDLFLASLPHRYFDEDQLHAFIITEIKDYDKCMTLLNSFLPYVNNWATCDQMSPKVFKKHKPELLKQIKKWIKSKKTYTIRFAIKMLMDHFLDEDYDVIYPEWVVAVSSDEYYIHMMKAWYFATALAKQYDSIIPYIEGKKLDTKTHNKAIQKAIESYRITDEQKEYLKTLRIK